MNLSNETKINRQNDYLEELETALKKDDPLNKSRLKKEIKQVELRILSLSCENRP